MYGTTDKKEVITLTAVKVAWRDDMLPRETRYENAKALPTLVAKATIEATMTSMLCRGRRLQKTAERTRPTRKVIIVGAR